MASNRGMKKKTKTKINRFTDFKRSCSNKLQSSLVRGSLKGYKGKYACRMCLQFGQRLYKEITEYSQILKNNTFRPRKQNSFLGKITGVNITSRETCPSLCNVCLYQKQVIRPNLILAWKRM